MKYFAPLLIALLTPSLASAASLSLTPQSLSVAPGQSFTLTVIANPASSTITSVRADISYDPRILQETWFTFTPGWLVVSEPTYDSVDTINGTAIKTAGYPGGITRPTQFGIVTFTARAPGKTTIMIAGDTLMLNGTNDNQFSGNSGATVVQVLGGSRDVIHATSTSSPSSSLSATAVLAPHSNRFLPTLFGAVKRFLSPY